MKHMGSRPVCHDTPCELFSSTAEAAGKHRLTLNIWHSQLGCADSSKVQKIDLWMASHGTAAIQLTILPFSLLAF
jgi:hypothetical protein